MKRWKVNFILNNMINTFLWVIPWILAKVLCAWDVFYTNLFSLRLPTTSIDCVFGWFGIFLFLINLYCCITVKIYFLSRLGMQAILKMRFDCLSWNFDSNCFVFAEKSIILIFKIVNFFLQGVIICLWNF